MSSTIIIITPPTRPKVAEEFSDLIQRTPSPYEQAKQAIENAEVTGETVQLINVP